MLFRLYFTISAMLCKLSSSMSGCYLRTAPEASIFYEWMLLTHCFFNYLLVRMGATYALSFTECIATYTLHLKVLSGKSCFLVRMGATHALCCTECTLHFYPQCYFRNVLAVMLLRYILL